MASTDNKVTQPTQSKSPAEVAREILKESHYTELSGDPHSCHLVDAKIVEIITTALENERERCARIAENWWTMKSTVGSPEAEAFQCASFEIATAIRGK